MTLSPCLHVKLLITAIGASGIVPPLHNLFDFPAQRPFPPHVQHVVIHFIVASHFMPHSGTLPSQAYKSPSPWSPEAKGLVHLQTPLGLLGLTFVPPVYIWFLFGCDHKLNRVKGKNSREPISCCQPELKRERLFFPSIFNVLTATCCLVSQTPRVVLISSQVDSVEPST